MSKPLPSTINQVELEKLPLFDCPPGQHADRNMGSGCFMDPPGYPTYFIQNVYTESGNYPSRGATAVIFGRVIDVAEWAKGDTWDGRIAKHDKLMRRLYVPPAIDHPRVQAWARSCAAYFGKSVTPTSGSRKVADLLFLRLDDIKRMLDSGELGLERCRVADYILEHFPDFPRDDLYTLCTTSLPHGKGKGGDGTWWEVLEEKPTPATCPGDAPKGRPGRHPFNAFNGTWCQVCGWPG